eukprot:g45157.t1
MQKCWAQFESVLGPLTDCHEAALGPPPAADAIAGTKLFSKRHICHEEKIPAIDPIYAFHHFICLNLSTPQPPLGKQAQSIQPVLT